MDNQTCFLARIFFYTCDLHLKARHFQPIEHNFFIKWLFKLVLRLVALSFKIPRLWNFYTIWFFIKVIQWTCTFIEGGMFLLYKKIEINCMILCPPFDYFSKNVQGMFLLYKKFEINCMILCLLFYYFSKNVL